MQRVSEAHQRGEAPADEDRDALVGLLELIVLGCLDRLNPPAPRRGSSRPPGLHSSSNNPAKTFVVDFITKFIDGLGKGGGGKAATGPVDAPSTSVTRGTPLEDVKLPLARHLRRGGGAAPDVVVLGHTHRAGEDEMGDADAPIRIYNVGSWIVSAHIPEPQSTLFVVRPDAESTLVPVVLAGA